jgi:hypothetical protein
VHFATLVDHDDNHIRPWFDGDGKPETKERKGRTAKNKIGEKPWDALIMRQKTRPECA